MDHTAARARCGCHFESNIIRERGYSFHYKESWNCTMKNLKDKGVSLFKFVKEEAFDALEKICRRIGKRIPLETSKAK